jgi:hypothetical protein
MTHGSVDIARISNDPELYAVTFSTPGEARGATRSARTFPRLEDVDEFLQRVGIPADRFRPALLETDEHETSSIGNVFLEEAELSDLGLRTSSAADCQPG